MAKGERGTERMEHHARARIEEALGERSLQWFGQKAKIPYATLHSQVRGRQKLALGTVVAAATIFRRPVAWFLPGWATVPAELAAQTYHEIEQLVIAAREGDGTATPSAPGTAGRALDASEAKHEGERRKRVARRKRKGG